MDTKNEHVKNLSAARERLIIERRALASELAKPYERVLTSECREKFIAVQKTIEAIDLALADEKHIAKASRTPMGGEMVTNPRRGDFYNRG
jgi:hypothetical protein